MPQPTETEIPIRWFGAQPDKAVAAQLRAGGVKIKTHQGELVAVLVVYTGPLLKLEFPPDHTIPTRWIWVTDQPVPSDVEVAAVLAGAYDVVSLSGPGATTRLITRLREAAVAESMPLPDPGLIAESPAARHMLVQVARAARTSMPVLLTGETGTGKEVCARLLHTWSARAARGFVPIDCAAIPNELMEAELFGHARGAFSGAVAAYDGQLVAAEGGTVFLDEVDDTPISTQAKLLRVLEDRVVCRIGESTRRTVDFRLVTATNRDLRTLIASGAFLPDLYERLAIVAIDLPPLRARLEDLPALLRHLIARFYREEPAARATGVEVTATSPAALAALAAYPWPGNVRELRNVLFETLVYKRTGDEILLSDLPRRILVRHAGPRAARAGDPQIIDTAAVRARVAAGVLNLRAEIDSLERTALEAALERAHGNAARAAELLGEVGHGRSRDPGNTVRAMIKRHRPKGAPRHT